MSKNQLLMQCYFSGDYVENLRKPATSRGKRGGVLPVRICFFTELSLLSVSQSVVRTQARTQQASASGSSA